MVDALEYMGSTAGSLLRTNTPFNILKPNDQARSIGNFF
jgi:hypothetical protein